MVDKYIVPKDNIFLFDNVLSPNHCKELIEVIEKYADKEENLKMKGNNVQSKTCSITCIREKNTELYEKWDKIIYDAVNKIIFYLQKSGIGFIRSDTGYQLRKIHGSTRNHIDGCMDSVLDENEHILNRNRVRIASIVIALNSDYDGGEFIFTRQDVKIKLKAGQAVVFPPYWTHPHETGELNGTYRYTINTWLTH